MSFKKEVMEQLKALSYGVTKLHQSIKLSDAKANILNEQIRRLQEEKESLLDRLMARNFEELKIYATSDKTPEAYAELNLDEDETNAGEVVD